MTTSIPPSAGKHAPADYKANLSEAEKGSEALRADGDAFARAIESTTGSDKQAAPREDGEPTPANEAEEQGLVEALEVLVAGLASALATADNTATEKAATSPETSDKTKTDGLGALHLGSLVKLAGALASGESKGDSKTESPHRNILPGSSGERREAGRFFRRALDRSLLESLADSQLSRNDVERVEITKPRRDPATSPLMRHFSLAEGPSPTEQPKNIKPKATSAADLARELQFSRGERGTSARAVLDVGRGREVALKLRHHQGIMTVEIDASADEISRKLVHHVQELSRSLQGLDVGRGRVQIDGALVGEWSDPQRQRDGDGTQFGAPPSAEEERDDEQTINVIRHAAVTGQLHIVT